MAPLAMPLASLTLAAAPGGSTTSTSNNTAVKKSVPPSQQSLRAATATRHSVGSARSSRAARVLPAGANNPSVHNSSSTQQLQKQKQRKRKSRVPLAVAAGALAFHVGRSAARVSVRVVGGSCLCRTVCSVMKQQLVGSAS